MHKEGRVVFVFLLVALLSVSLVSAVWYDPSTWSFFKQFGKSNDVRLSPGDFVHNITLFPSPAGLSAVPILNAIVYASFNGVNYSCPLVTASESYYSCSLPPFGQTGLYYTIYMSAPGYVSKIASLNPLGPGSDDVTDGLQPIAPTCIDSDITLAFPDGKNYGTMGSVTTAATASNPSVTIPDECHIVTSPSSGAAVSSCSGGQSSCSVTENFCSTTNPNAVASGGLDYVRQPCANGCSNGACNAAPAAPAAPAVQLGEWVKDAGFIILNSTDRVKVTLRNSVQLGQIEVTLDSYFDNLFQRIFYSVAFSSNGGSTQIVYYFTSSIYIIDYRGYFQAPETSYQVRLTRFPFPLPQYNLTVQVRNATTWFLSEAFVNVTNISDGRVVAVGYTNATGGFMTTLANGTYNVSVRATNYLLNSTRAVLTQNRLTSVFLSPVPFVPVGPAPLVTVADAAKLINIEMGRSSRPGSAAVGLVSSPQAAFWNNVTSSLSNNGVYTLTSLRSSNGVVVSGAEVSIRNLGGVWGLSPGTSGVMDPMFVSYLYPYGNNKNMASVQLKGFASGTYDMYVYGHQGVEGKNGVYTLVSTAQGVSPVKSTTSSLATLRTTTVWQENVQFVKFLGIRVQDTSDVVTLLVLPGSVSSEPVISGIQLVKTA